MILSFDERLKQILPRVTSRDFLDSKGLGKVNYGKFGDLLANVKVVTGGASDD